MTARGVHAVRLFGSERILFNTDCRFATFADNPVVDAEMAEAKMAVLTQARDRLVGRR
ncbi:MAG: 5-methyltetrahydropteroyltriglutamate--homocysteine methyltransferase [Acidimicrobiaceae bacterium]|nr:5-methyltetrahydropteroyltriglutamate--homocysteine methyltransferase [Acidimicrobiaceae bacterium]